MFWNDSSEQKYRKWKKSLDLKLVNLVVNQNCALNPMSGEKTINIRQCSVSWHHLGAKYHFLQNSSFQKGSWSQQTLGTIQISKNKVIGSMV